jgi:hypothetical protein
MFSKFFRSKVFCSNCNIRFSELLSQRGVLLVEATLALGIVIFLTFAGIDVARYFATTNKLRYALTEALKKAESDDQLFGDVWNSSSDSTTAVNFRQARTEIVNTALSKIVGKLDGSITLQPVLHKDRYQGGASENTLSSIGILLPGISATLNGSGRPIHNPFKCSPFSEEYESQNNNGDILNGSGVFTSCNSTKSVNYSANNLAQLTKVYPMVFTANFTQRTFFFGNINSHVAVSGYRLFSEAYVPPNPPTDNPPSGNKCPNEVRTENNTYMCIPSAGFLWDHFNYNLKSKNFPPIKVPFIGTLNPNLKPGHKAAAEWIGFNTNYNILCDAKECCGMAAKDGVVLNPVEHIPCIERLNKGNCEFLCNRTGGGCFKEGTRILTNLGYKNVEALTKNDLIVNPKSGKLMKIKKVVFGPEKINLIKFVISSGVTLNVTTKHPMLTDRGIIKAKDVSKNDKLKIQDGSFEAINSIEEIKISTNSNVHNLELDVVGDKFEDHLVIADGVITGDLFVQQKLQ